MIEIGLKDYAVSEGLGTYGSDLFVRIMPDSPENAICIFSETGIITPEMHDTAIDGVGSEWLIRGAYNWASSKAWEIHGKVANFSGIYNGIDFDVTQIQTPPSFVDNDENGLALFTIHYLHDVVVGVSEHRTAI